MGGGGNGENETVLAHSALFLPVLMIAWFNYSLANGVKG